MERSSLKERLKNGEKVIGTWNIIPSPSLVEAIGYGGLDFIIIDAEHGPVGMETAENLVRAAQVSGMAPSIRVADNVAHLILRALDIGAYGIQVPHISTVKEAEKVVEYAKYHPQGKRGLSVFTRDAKFGIAAKNHVSNSNPEKMIIINIEGIEGIKNLAKIVDVQEVDVIFIGPYDLSQSLGKPGKVNDPEVINIIKSSAKLIRDKAKVCGSFAADPTYLKILVDCGIQYITYTVDCEMISSNYKHLKDSFKKLIRSKGKV